MDSRASNTLGIAQSAAHRLYVVSEDPLPEGLEPSPTASAKQALSLQGAWYRLRSHQFSRGSLQGQAGGREPSRFGKNSQGQFAKEVEVPLRRYAGAGSTTAAPRRHGCCSHLLSRYPTERLQPSIL